MARGPGFPGTVALSAASTSIGLTVTPTSVAVAAPYASTAFTSRSVTRSGKRRLGAVACV